MKILIVDDDEEVRKMVSGVLIAQQFCPSSQVYEATTGHAAWEILQKHTPDLLISSLNMPVKQGGNLINLARSHLKNIEIIIMSSFDEIDTVARFLVREDIADILRKPFKEEELAFAVRKIVSKQRLKLEVEEYGRRLITADQLSSVGLLAAGFAHEINNPNTFIKGNLSILSRLIVEIQPALQELAKSGKKEFLIAAEKMSPLVQSGLLGCDRIQKIISGLLTLSRKPDGQKKPIFLTPHLHEALLLTQYRLKKYKISITEDPQSRQILGSEQEMIQVLTNLLINAADALDQRWSGSNEGTLAIRVYDEIVTSKQIIRIADNGPGISAENCERIFDPFFTTKPVGQGTGLGLFIVKGIIENSGGHILCESSPNQGTTFIIQLPLAE